MKDDDIIVNKPVILQLKDLLVNEGFSFAFNAGPNMGGHLLSGANPAMGRLMEASNAFYKREGSDPSIIEFGILCNHIVRKERIPSTLFLCRKTLRKVIGGLILKRDGTCTINIHGEEYFMIGKDLARKISDITSFSPAYRAGDFLITIFSKNFTIFHKLSLPLI